MKQRHGANWRQFASRAAGGDAKGDLDVYGLLKTILDNYSDVFRHDAHVRKARSYVSLALDARNSSSHFGGLMQDREALRYLDAIRELLEAIGAKPQVKIVDRLYEQQKSANPAAENQATKEEARLEEPPTPDKLLPWREVAQPHPDVLEARFTDRPRPPALVHAGLGADPGSLIGRDVHKPRMVRVQIAKVQFTHAPTAVALLTLAPREPRH
jgi:hypothetical protein